jgi:uncharacterized membrane protein (DUF106 family)
MFKSIIFVFLAGLIAGLLFKGIAGTVNDMEEIKNMREIIRESIGD